MFHSLSRENREVWKAAYEAYHAPDAYGFQKLSYDVDFLARRDLFSRGRLLPGMSPDGAWPPFLLQLYQSFSDCADYVYSSTYFTRDYVTRHLSDAEEKLKKVLDETLPEEAATEIRKCCDLVAEAKYNASSMVSEFFSRKEHIEVPRLDE
jgi:hypothetical protein